MKKGKKLKVQASPVNSSTLHEPEIAYQVNPSAKNYALFSEGVPSLTSFLGKEKNVPQTIDGMLNKHQYINIIREGVKMQTLEHLMDTTGITPSEMSSIIHTSERTLRRYTTSTILSPEQSERIIELARLFSRGSEVFGSLNNFKTWMNSKVLALGNIQPKNLLDTSLGIEILQEELGRIEHGIFA